jgi:hypothetical protein
VQRVARYLKEVAAEQSASQFFVRRFLHPISLLFFSFPFIA